MRKERIAKILIGIFLVALVLAVLAFDSSPMDDMDKPAVTEVNELTVHEVEQAVERACVAYNASGEKILEGSLHFEIVSIEEIKVTLTVSGTLRSDQEHLLGEARAQLYDYLDRELEKIGMPQFYVVRTTVEYTIERETGDKGRLSESPQPVYFGTDDER